MKTLKTLHGDIAQSDIVRLMEANRKIQGGHLGTRQCWQSNIYLAKCISKAKTWLLDKALGKALGKAKI